MSAAAVWDRASASASASASAVARSRGRLVLVPTGEAVGCPNPRGAPLRRAGRLCLTLVAIVVVAVAVAALRGAGSTAVVDHATVVHPGQTLSEVAQQQLPQLPVSEAVVRIQLANNLPSAQVRAGQSLLIPVLG